MSNSLAKPLIKQASFDTHLSANPKHDFIIFAHTVMSGEHQPMSMKEQSSAPLLVAGLPVPIRCYLVYNVYVRTEKDSATPAYPEHFR